MRRVAIVIMSVKSKSFSLNLFVLFCNKLRCSPFTANTINFEVF